MMKYRRFPSLVKVATMTMLASVTLALSVAVYLRSSLPTASDYSSRIIAELAPDKRTLVISFADGYTMPAGTRFCIQLVGSDLASIMFGNWPEPEEYSFTTK